MIDIKSRVQGVADREKWAARGASFVAKAKATKVVWFPPEPVGSARKGASTARRTTEKTAKKAASPTSKAAKKATKSPTGAAKKASKKAGSATKKK